MNNRLFSIAFQTYTQYIFCLVYFLSQSLWPTVIAENVSERSKLNYVCDTLETEYNQSVLPLHTFSKTLITIIKRVAFSQHVAPEACNVYI